MRHPRPCGARGKPLRVSGLNLSLDYIPNIPPGGGAVCVGAAPDLMAAVNWRLSRAILGDIGGITVESSSYLMEPFNSGSLRLLQELESKNNSLIPPDTSLPFEAILGGEPEPKMVPARLNNASMRYLACYGSNGLPIWYMAPVLALPQSVSASMGLEGVPLLLVTLDYQEGSPSLYPKQECSGLPWRMLAYLALAGGAVAAALFILLRVMGR